MDPFFLELMRNNLAMWREEVEGMSDREIDYLQQNFGSLTQMLSYALRTPPTVYESAQLVIKLAPLIEKADMVASWLPILEQAVAHVPKDVELYGELLRQLGFSHWLHNRAEKSRDILQQAIDVATANEWHVIHGGALHCLAFIAFYMGELLHSNRLSEQAQAIFQKVQSNTPLRSQALSLGVLAMIAHAHGRYDDALTHWGKADTLWTELDDITHHANVLSGRARALRELGRYDEALQNVIAAEEMLAATTNQLGLAHMRIIRGTTLMDMGRFEEADELFDKADTDFLQRSNRRDHVAHIAANRGEIRLEQGKYEEALPYIQHAVVILAELEDYRREAYARILLAKVYIGAMQSNLAKEQLLFALNCLDKFEEHLGTQQRKAIHDLLNQLTLANVD